MDQRKRIMVVNAQAASAPDKHTERVVRRAFRAAIDNNVDVIAWCEVGDVWVKGLGMVHTPEWNTMQFGPPGQDQPESGLAASWLQKDLLTNFRRNVGSKATSEGSWKTGAGIRERSIMSCLMYTPNWNTQLNIIHPPPLRAPQARASYIAKALKKPGITAGDTNFLHKALVRMPGKRRRRVRSVGLLAIFVPARFHVSKPFVFDVGSDHDAFYVTIEPKAARKARLDKKKEVI